MNKEFRSVASRSRLVHPNSLKCTHAIIVLATVSTERDERDCYGKEQVKQEL